MQSICEALVAYHSTYTYVDDEICVYCDACDEDLEENLPGLECANALNSQFFFGNESDCDCNAAMISLEEPITQFADQVDRSSPQVKEFMCISRSTIEVMRNNLLANPEMKWQYVASDYGATLVYPGHRSRYRSNSNYTCLYPQEECPTFDARLLDWYAGITPPSNIILLLDKSGSMKEQGRIDQMKEAARLILGELTYRDRVAVVFFDQVARLCEENIDEDGSPIMLSASLENRARLRGCIDRVEPWGESDLTAGFQMAYDVLEEARHGDDFVCISSILFFTDGRGNEGGNPLQVIVNRQDDMGVRIFSFVLGTALDSYNMQSIACEGDGLSFTLRQNLNLRTQMTKYHQLLAYDRGQSKQVLWSVSRYREDLGDTVTASLPCHSEDGALLGLAAIDVPVSSFMKYDDWSEKLTALQNRSEICDDQRPTDDYLRWLRGGECNYCDPSLCGLALHAFIGVASVSGAFILTGTLVIFLYVILLNARKLKKKYALRRHKEDSEELLTRQNRSEAKDDAHTLRAALTENVPSREQTEVCTTIEIQTERDFPLLAEDIINAEEDGVESPLMEIELDDISMGVSDALS